VALFPPQITPLVGRGPPPHTPPSQRLGTSILAPAAFDHSALPRFWNSDYGNENISNQKMFNVGNQENRLDSLYLGCNLAWGGWFWKPRKIGLIGAPCLWSQLTTDRIRTSYIGFRFVQMSMAFKWLEWPKWNTITGSQVKWRLSLSMCNLMEAQRSARINCTYPFVLIII